MADPQQQQQQRQQQLLNDDTRPIADFITPNAGNITNPIQPPVFNREHFDVHTQTIQFIQQNSFGGLPSEDPHQHLSTFNRICRTIRRQGAPEDAIKLELFPWSLRDSALSWLNLLPHNHFQTWADLAQGFLTQFCPPSKMSKLRHAVSSFALLPGENMGEAWERYKNLQRRCPNHGINRWFLIETFFEALDGPDQGLLNAAANGSLLKKSYLEAYDLIEDMAKHTLQASSRRMAARKPGMIEVDEPTLLRAQLEAITRERDELRAEKKVIAQVNTRCSECGGTHAKGNCPLDAYNDEEAGHSNVEQANYAENQPRQQYNAYAKPYNQPWRNNSNSADNHNAGGSNQQGYNNYQKPQQQAYQPPHRNQDYRQQGSEPREQKAGWELAVERLANSTTDKMQEISAKMGQLMDHNQKLEMQLGQISNSINQRRPGDLPSKPETNPREYCKAVVLRSGKELQQEASPSKKDEEVTPVTPEPAKKKEAEEVPQRQQTEQQPRVYNPPIPFPQRLIKQKKEEQFKKFLEMFKQLKITIPFSEALNQMPSYVKFLKELLVNKKKMEEHATVSLTENCSAILQRKLPPKLRDPGSFSIPCTIGNLNFDQALCDLGASVSLIPYSMCERLGLGEVQPTSITLQLADKSVKKPVGILENAPLQVKNLIIPVDLIALDMEEAGAMPLILGRPFLATAGAIIDVKGGKLTLNIGEEKIAFNVFRSIKHPGEEEQCLAVDVIESLIREETEGMKDFGSFLLEDEQDFGAEDASEALAAHEISRFIEELGPRKSLPPPSIVQAPEIEKKALPDHLKYVYLQEEDKLPVIVASELQGKSWSN